ncbi:unnamed protein product [Heligmosomoides polygyrus]|uniref:Uncharacterized protein n=1 Tax=Heligmosomoides polygyrus TaxID=6339 RepID=A0A3P8AF15_HELPZ|nr:unnamed protein product [Heligmosomoides polygyrus]
MDEFLFSCPNRIVIQKLSPPDADAKGRVAEEKLEVVDYEACDTAINSLVEEDIDVNRLPNDLLAKYIICEELGQGAYGTVYRAVERATGKTWAAKMVQVRPGVKKDDVLHEISVMKELNHEKLLHLHEVFDMGSEMCLIEEFVSGGELLDKVMEDDMLMSEEEARNYTVQILLGIAYMHSKQFVHLDLKPENILLKSKNSTELKIIDFGLARKLDPDKTVKLLFGTPEFCAPEVVNHEPVSFSTDMWTVGVIAYVLLSGLSPFLGDTDVETLANVSAADWDFDDPSWDDVSESAKACNTIDFICRLMCKDKRRRLTVQQALQHPWITKKKFMALKRWSDDLLPIGRLAKRGAIFRQQSMGGVFERNISFDADCPPAMKKQLEDIVTYVGELIATLSCEVDGSPLPRISWFKDEKELSVPSLKYDSQFNNGLAELTVKDIERSDSGVYLCRATNELGTTSSGAKLTVKERKADTTPPGTQKVKTAKVKAKDGKTEQSKPSFDPGLSDCVAVLGGKLTLSVKAASTSEVTVEWFHNGNRICEADKRFVRRAEKNSFEIVLLNVTLDHAGRWTAIGRNAFGRCETECEVTVKIPDGHLAPTFEKRLEDVNCEETELLVLPVKIKAFPPPEISWFHDDEELQHSQNHRLQFDDESNEYSLTIVKAYTEDSGEYRCAARNLVGESESVCCVRIEEPEDKRSKKIDESKAPKFSMHLIDPREATEGAELVLSCIVTGTPRPKISWLKDGKRLAMSGKDASCDNGVCTLTITSTALTDSGRYTCEAENIHGKARSETAVTITYGIESGKCSRYKDGEKLVVENRMLQYLDRKGIARLNIMNCVPGDSGEYSCEAVNALGKDISECRVKVTEEKVLNIIDLAVHLGEDAEAAASSLSRSSTPSVSFSSEESRPPVITRPLIDTTVKAGLSLDFPQWIISGNKAFIKCSNKMGIVESRAMLIVEKESANDAPNIPVFIKKLQNVTVKEKGAPLSLSCQVRGMPPPVVRWMHNGQEISNISSYRCRAFDDGISTLEIVAVTEERCGTYTAVASSPHGDAHSSAVIKLDYVSDQDVRPPSPPVFIVEPKSNISVEEYSSLTIVCDVSGSPSMKVSWLKDDHPLDAAERVRIERDGITSRLVIVNVTCEDAGRYTVSAEDELGKVAVDSMVVVTPSRDSDQRPSIKLVKGPPTAVGEPTVEKCSKDSVSLSWSAPSETRGSPVEGYIVEQRTPDQQTWVEAATTTRPRCTIMKLSSNTEYLFRVSAKNAQGLSESSPPAKARTLPAGTKPQFTESPPQSLTVIEGEELRVAVRFSGSPSPAVKWYKNGREITELDGSVAIDDSSSTLTITKARSGEEDAVFSCHIENEMGQASTEISVSVIVTKDEAQDIESRSDHSDRALVGAPAVAIPLSNETVQTGQQFILTCKFSAKDGTAAWYHNDDRISSRGRYELFSSSNGAQRLICHGSCTADSGIYRCVLTNDKGVAQTECEVFVKDAAEQTAPVFEKDLEDVTVLTGKSLVLSCKAAGQPDPELVWTKDGERLATSRRVRLQFDEKGSSELHLCECTAQDAGIYVCTASNSSGVQSSQCTLTVAEVSGTDAHLVIAEEEKVAKPRFIRAPPSTLEAQEGGQIKLIAKAVGEPKPTITWKKDGREVLRTNRLYKTYLTGDGESHLVVECVVSKTSGIFTCIAHNVHGEAEAETQVFVHRTKSTLPVAEKPAFSQHLKDTGVVTGHPVTLSCKVHGVPDPELKWYYIDDAGNVTSLTDDEHGWIECRGGEVDGFARLSLYNNSWKESSEVIERIIVRSHLMAVETITAMAELKAECVLRNQQGTYKCVASNEHGQASSVCYLLVGDLKDERAGPPRFLRCLRDIWVPLGEEVVFEVEVAGYPAPDLTWYHQDKRVPEGKNVKINYTSENVCELRVLQVSLRDLGSYAVEASNVHGVVRTTSSLNVGEPRHAEAPQFQQVEEPGIEVKPKVAFREQVKKSASTVRMEFRKKGAAPIFLQGLEDMELEAGASAAVAGKLGRSEFYDIFRQNK